MHTIERAYERIRRELTQRQEQGGWPDEINIHQVERAVSVTAGVGLVGFGLLGGGLVRAAVIGAGALLVRRGMTGRSALYSHLRLSSAHGLRGPAAAVPHGQGVRIRRTTTVRRAPDEVYARWRDLEALPEFLRVLDTIEVLSDRRSRWRARGPAESTLEWEAEIINDLPGELIAWRSTRGSSVHHAGSIRFERTAGGHGTRVTVTLEYQPPAGLVGALAGRLLGVDPERLIDEALHALKTSLEEGVVPRPEAEERGTLAGIHDLEDARSTLQERERPEDAASADGAR
ncbi:MAG: SRPBCC family protein [Nannocystaceae bacterium]